MKFGLYIIRILRQKLFKKRGESGENDRNLAPFFKNYIIRLDYKYNQNPII